MSTIVTRAGKGSPLTHNEVDANFNNLNNDKYQSGDSPSFAGTTLSSGNLTFSSTGQRITGDMSNATWANRLAVQTSTTNGNTNLTLLPNGTGIASQVVISNSSDTANNSYLGLVQVGTTDSRIQAGIQGTGTYTPMTFYTGGSERMRLDTSGNLGIGTTPSYRLHVAATAPTNSILAYLTNSQGGSTRSRVALQDASTTFAPDLGSVGNNITFDTVGAERMRIDSSGNVGIGTASAAAGGLLTLNRAPAAAFGTPMLQVGGASFTSGGYYSIGLGFTDATYTEPPGEIAFVTTSDSGGTLGSIVFGTRSVTTNTAVTERMRIDSSGNVGIGGTAGANEKLTLTGTLPTSSNTSKAISVQATSPSGSTSDCYVFESYPATQAAAFTLGSVQHFRAVGVTIGASSVITNQYGFLVSSNLTGATNNYGFYSNIASAANRWNFYAAGTASNYFAGNVGINVSPVSVFKLHVAAATDVTVGIADGTGVAGALTFNAVNNANSANVPLDFRSSATYFSTGIGTTGSAANAYIDNTANNQLLRSTSSLRYKRDVATYARGLSELMTLRAVSFKGISESDGDKTFAGLIAEEVHDAGLTEFVAYDKEGRPDALHYGNMVALLVKAVQELKAELEALKAA